MIAELAISVEETFGIVATRFCRALHSKSCYFEILLININTRIYLKIRSHSSSISTDMRRARIHFCCCSNRSFHCVEYSLFHQW